VALLPRHSSICLDDHLCRQTSADNPSSFIIHRSHILCIAPFPTPVMTSLLSHPSSFLPRRPSCVHKMSLDPPTYTPSATVPAYSVIPRPSERTLAATACSRRRTPTGVFLRSNSLITLALREQEPDASMPSYGRHGVISGDIGLGCTQGVQSVYLKVRVYESFFRTY
jgi:hypothetical protein